MTKKLIEKFKDTRQIEVIFANTGCEDPKTLEFIKNCDDYFGFNTTWVEAVVSPEFYKGVRAKVVDFDSAARNGEPFEAVVAKYGIPSASYPHCTGRLKSEVIYFHLRENVGWKGQRIKDKYYTAIGIRADEQNRCSKNAEKQGIIYPLVKWGYNKERVLAECKTWPFDLEIPEHYGNCTWCWKKSHRKLLTLARESPQVFDFPLKLEEKYSTLQNNGIKRVSFRGNKSARDILEESKGDFEKFIDDNYTYNNNSNLFLDNESSCSESCEIGTDSADRESFLVKEKEWKEAEEKITKL